MESVHGDSELFLEEIDNASTTHRQRVKIGDRLAKIGDPRPGVGLRGDGLPHPVKAFDMSGNVLEWCLNEYANPRTVEVAGDGRRALRGGSWYDFRLVARCAFRGVNYPDFRDDTIGFRLLCSSPHLLNH